MKKCKNCGEEFEPKIKTQKFCCAECRVMTNNKQHLAEITGVKPKRKKTKSINTDEAIADINLKAKRAGMSYGKYVLMQQMKG